MCVCVRSGEGGGTPGRRSQEGDLLRRTEQQLARWRSEPNEREANLVYIHSAISSPLKPCEKKAM